MGEVLLRRTNRVAGFVDGILRQKELNTVLVKVPLRVWSFQVIV